jgi:TolA-binding protein
MFHMNLECQRWAGLADLEALGEPLPSDGRAFQQAHELACADCAREATIWRGMRLAEAAGAPDEAEVEHILSLAGAARLRVASSRRWRSAVVVVGGVTACAAAMLLWLSGSSGQPHLPAHDLQARLAAPAASKKQAPDGASAEPTARGPDQGCSELVPGATVCLAPGTLLGRRALSGPAREVEVSLGRAVVSLAPQLPGMSFSLTTSAGKVTAVGTIFSVDVSADGTTIARVVEGKVWARFGSQTGAQALHAGQALRLGEQQARALSDQEREADLALLGSSAAPPSASPSASAAKPAPAGDPAAPRDMLAYARSLRASGDFQRAAEVYRQIHNANPQSPSGRAALVSLGDLLLTLHDAQGALNAFDGYLASSGTLAQEAAFGRVRALRGLNRSAEEQRAIEHFIAAYPDAPQSRVLRARLAAIQK